MDRSLSVLLPVRNAQASLSVLVHDLVEVMPELTRNWELLVLDDGSTDATVEVADELSALYPQVEVVAYGQPLGWPEVIRIGLARTSGEFLFLRHPQSSVAIDEARKLWLAVQDHEIVFGVCRRNGLRRRSRRRVLGEERLGGFLMARRRTMESLVDYLGDLATLRTALAGLGHSWQEVEMRHREPAWQGRFVPGRPHAAPPAPGGNHLLPNGSEAEPSRPRRPNYLARIREGGELGVSAEG